MATRHPKIKREKNKTADFGGLVRYGTSVVVGMAWTGADGWGGTVKILETTILSATNTPKITNNALAIFKPRFELCVVFF